MQILNCMFFLSLGMPTVLGLAGLVLMLLTTSARSESAELRFQGQTQFVVNESSRAIVRLVVERVGDPVNVTALVLVSLEEQSASSFLSVCVSDSCFGFLMYVANLVL